MRKQGLLFHCHINTLRPGENGRHFVDDIFKRVFLNENVCTLIDISLKFVPWGPINNMPALVQIMAWRRPGDKSLSEPMMVKLLTHVSVTRPQWIKNLCRVHLITFDYIDYIESYSIHVSNMSPRWMPYYLPDWCMMTSSNGNFFRITGHLCGDFTGHPWIPRTKASDVELWCFLWHAPQ